MRGEKPPQKPPPITVAVDAEGKITLDGDPVSEAELLHRLRNRQERKPESKPE